MARNPIRTGGTLAVLLVVLVVMLVFGWKAVSAPFPALGSSPQKCQTVKVKSQIFRKEIAVSVYNATKRKGLADSTMAALERRHFRPGVVGNAPSGTKVRYVEIRSTTEDDPAAILVARQFKPAATVVVEDDELGPGVDVMLGPRFRRLHTPAPKSVKLAKPIRTCLDATPDGT